MCLFIFQDQATYISVYDVCLYTCMSVYFSGSGNIYVWGSGLDGQLGLGNSNTFQSFPKKLKHPELRRSVVKIQAGEYYSTAITGTC